MTFTRRSLASLLVGALKVLGESRPSQNKEDEEFEEAYHLAGLVRSDRPKSGFVPSAEVAMELAKVVTKTLYGGPKGYDERPFRSRLRGNVWTVMGTLHPAGALGGVAIVQISKLDGRILFAHHTE